MQWWCSARGLPWTWQWRPYPGVWLFAAVAAVVLVYLCRRAGNGRGAVAACAALALWAALDWPLGTLGAGYLASAHMVQYVLITAVVAPLALRATASAASVSTPLGTVRAWPVVLVVATCNAAVATTHAPAVVDGLMRSQLGSFGLDACWVAAGLLLWWPVMRALPRCPPLHEIQKIAYIIGATFANTGVAMYLLLAAYPVYRTYELAPPMRHVSVLDDQQLAGGVMLLAGLGVVIGTMTYLFFHWARRTTDADVAPVPEQSELTRSSLGGASPGARAQHRLPGGH